MKNSQAIISFPIEEITDENDPDRWLTCMCCNYPVKNEYQSEYSPKEYLGQPVEYIVSMRTGGARLGKGLHKVCLELNNKLCDYVLKTNINDNKKDNE